MLDNRRYFLYPFTVDIRKSFDGLAGHVRNDLSLNPRMGDVYIFFNGTRQFMKMLFYDGNGYVILFKKLDEGRFQVPAGRSDDLGFYVTRLQVLQLIRGIRMETVFRRSSG
jgi:transposase